ncbi:MAG: hypothetical protein U9R75_05455, partial [Candidatus Thermoplasmatota archaeon]|nr:hypothetical protein [Candidatus Thermoplasmatota archaeon]
PVNDPPFNVEIIGGTSFYLDDFQIFYACAEDPDLEYGDGLEFTWTSNISGEIGVGSSINVSLPVGIHNITLTASDNEGMGSSCSIDVNIRGVDDFNVDDPEGAIPLWIIVLIVSLILVLIISSGLSIFNNFIRKKEPSDVIYTPEDDEIPIPFKRAPPIPRVSVNSAPDQDPSESTVIIPVQNEGKIQNGKWIGEEIPMKNE